MLERVPKFKTLRQLEVLVNSFKGKGKTIILANGCFDIIHVGHIRYLTGAKALGDILIVAINSDESTKALKGSGRPVTNEEERVEIISALECVDYITLFPERNVENILLTLKPHIHAKGSDYTLDTVPERETVKSYGGKVAITGDPKDHSSKDIIRKISNFGGSSSE
ncbi:MAG: ADP-heptose synthase [Candidatus Schekmanbacteria bacterium RBG_16_38_11]|uniref:ADP-heptose synthase n=2 Tax=Candidatus Schekmaniibacteriota TaxID=1817811 RepID=A0A1F7RED0_9BACT|nr:MAG: ADP-heptose synthase [Candidatus Schekmanbacteria bacterium GWA2_38_11]OGL45096.1 MAG: ADP-heptose synthase [Candidatus Schekmanbacteria bacterium RBG_16_38_11]